MGQETRDLSEGEREILDLVRQLYGNRNTPEEVFLSRHDEAVLFVKDEQGQSPIVANLTFLAEQRQNGTTLDAVRKWLTPSRRKGLRGWLEDSMTRFVQVLDRIGIVTASSITFSPQATKCCEMARVSGGEEPDSLHLLIALLSEEDCGFRRFLKDHGSDIARLKKLATDQLAAQASLDRAFNDIFRGAVDLVPKTRTNRKSPSGRPLAEQKIHTIHFLWGMIKTRSSHAAKLLRSELPDVMEIHTKADVWTSWLDEG